jgi:hypothetical protein
MRGNLISLHPCGDKTANSMPRARRWASKSPRQRELWTWRPTPRSNRVSPPAVSSEHHVDTT